MLTWAVDAVAEHLSWRHRVLNEPMRRMQEKGADRVTRCYRWSEWTYAPTWPCQISDQKI